MESTLKTISFFLLSKHIRALALFAVVGFSSASQANLLTNASFEAPGCATSCILDTPAEANYITGWTTVLSGVEYFNAPAFGFIAADGVMVVDLANYTYLTGGGICQTFATTIGTTYDISFSAGNSRSSGRDGTGIVVVDVANQHFEVPTAIATSAAMAWRTVDLSFTAVDNLSTLTFTNVQNPNFHFAGIDGVSVLRSTLNQNVPAPQTFALLLFGLGLLRQTNRRKN